MVPQLATVMQKSEGDFDELLVSVDRFDEHLRRVSDMIARRAFEIFEVVVALTATTGTIGTRQSRPYCRRSITRCQIPAMHFSLS